MASGSVDELRAAQGKSVDAFFREVFKLSLIHIFFQASKIFDAFYIFLIENPAVVVGALDVWDQPLVAVEFQSLVGRCV